MRVPPHVSVDEGRRPRVLGDRGLWQRVLGRSAHPRAIAVLLVELSIPGWGDCPAHLCPGVPTAGSLGDSSTVFNRVNDCQTENLHGRTRIKDRKQKGTGFRKELPASCLV